MHVLSINDDDDDDEAQPARCD